MKLFSKTTARDGAVAAPPVPEEYKRLLPRLNLGGDQPHTVNHLGTTRDVDDLGYILELHIVIALYKQNTLGAGLEDIGKTGGKIGQAYVILVNLQLGFSAARSFQNLYDHGAIGLHRFLVWRRRLGNQSIKPVRREWRDHHEDDEQHQQHVDQGRDINVGGLSSACTTH